MKHTIVLLLLTLTSCIGFSQESNFIASGKVIDTATGLPLSGASIFARNTTLGTITNAEGAFKLSLPRGGYDLVVSYTGYETQEIHINAGNSSDIGFALKTVDNTLTEVVVSGSNEVEDGLAKYGTFFLENFIGTTPNAEFCKIENPEALQFFFSKKRNRLKIKGREDLRIVNQALGYKIRYQLDSFAYDYNSRITTYSGYPFFEQLEGTLEEKAKWAEDRRIAYHGSKLHFMRAWYDSTLEKEGFAIEWIDTTKKTLVTQEVTNPYDSSTYSVVENDDVEIDRIGKWRVIYKKEMPDKKFLKAFKLPVYLKSQLTTLEILGI
ncbi:MAG: carboxypeptidase-like regulatory domain-containing protein, partial [Chitinophagaceae bacterium]